MRFVQQQTVAFTRGFVLIGTQKDFFQWSDGRARPSGIAVSLFLRFVSCVALAGGCNQPLRLSRQSSNESVVSWEQAGTMAPLAARRAFVMVGPAGPLATISREPGQARKGAAAAVTLCAGVWLVGFTSITKRCSSQHFRIRSVPQSATLLTCCHKSKRIASRSSAWMSLHSSFFSLQGWCKLS